MASTAFSLEVAKCLSEGGPGYSELKDSMVGDGVWEVEKRGFVFFTEYGLDFCKQHVLNSRIMPIIESFFDGEICVLAHWLKYTAYPGHISFFRSGGPEAGREALLVFLIAKGSRISYWSDSHRHALPFTEGKRHLHEGIESALLAAGCRRKEETYADGGLSIFDARLNFGIEKGDVIAFEFVTPKVIEQAIEPWPMMNLPDVPELRQKVADMGSSKIRTNFAFVVPKSRKRKRIS